MVHFQEQVSNRADGFPCARAAIEIVDTIEIVVKRVVADAGVEPDLEVVAGTPSARQDRSDMTAEVALHFQDKTADLPL